MNVLIWSPVYHILESQIDSGDELILLVTPFIKIDALKRLYEVQKNKSSRLKAVVRWHPEDIIFGASDLEVYPYLREHESQLYLNTSIHLKLYIFNTNAAFNTSGNLTLRGMGYTDNANIEIGNFVTLTELDWAKIYRIIDASHLVDDAIYDNYKRFLDNHKKIEPPIIPSDLLPPPKKYTISSLPATDDPARLFDYYLHSEVSCFTPEDTRRAFHDLVLYNIPPSLALETLERLVGTAFRASPFVQEFVDLLKQKQSLRFGAVNEWIHQKCEDVPLPYRWEIKANTRILYDWLEYFVPEISWDRPHHSQVIYWNRK